MPKFTLTQYGSSGRPGQSFSFEAETIDKANGVLEGYYAYSMAHQPTGGSWELSDKFGGLIRRMKLRERDCGDDFDTGDSKFKGTFRIACRLGDWRGTYGSQGA